MHHPLQTLPLKQWRYHTHTHTSATHTHTQPAGEPPGVSSFTTTMSQQPAPTKIGANVGSSPYTWSYQTQCVELLSPTIATHNQCMFQWYPTTLIYKMEMPAVTHTASPVSSLAQPVVPDEVIQTPRCQKESYQLPHNQGLTM